MTPRPRSWTFFIRLVAIFAIGLCGVVQWGDTLGQDDAEAVDVERLAQTLDLPFAIVPTTATLQRIRIAPGAALDVVYRDPVLFYIDQGTVKVDLKDHQIAIVNATEQARPQNEREFRRGRIPAGYSLYVADGNAGSLLNVGEGDVVLLAVIFVAQPGPSEVTTETTEATAVPVELATPVP